MLPDYIAPGLDVVFVGTSVATASATAGHYYSGPGNKFWEFLWEAGLTGDSILAPKRDSTVIQFRIGLTDIVKGRASSSDALLTATDYDVRGFLQKIDRYQPFVVVFNGKEAAKRVFKTYKWGIPRLGLATSKIQESLVYVLPSSAGSSADPQHFAPKASKVDWWKEFGGWLRSSRR